MDEMSIINNFKIRFLYSLLSAFVMLTSSLFQNFRNGASAFIVHSPLRTRFPIFFGTSCSISELRHEEESSPKDRVRRLPLKLTQPQPSNENIVGLLSFLYFLSLRFRTHLGLFWRAFGIVTKIFSEELRRKHMQT